jgi:hypothetical protein
MGSLKAAHYFFIIKYRSKCVMTKFEFYCLVFVFGAGFGTGYMALVNGVVAVATVKFLCYLYKNIDNLYLFILSLIPFILIVKTVSPVTYLVVWFSTACYVLFILYAIFKGKTSKDTKHMTATELYLELRDEAFKQKQQ